MPQKSCGNSLARGLRPDARGGDRDSLHPAPPQEPGRHGDAGLSTTTTTTTTTTTSTTTTTTTAAAAAAATANHHHNHTHSYDHDHYHTNS